ncbi:peptidylprolyl isomerase [Micromonospora sp. WMMD714]|uniref:peptidylprolyl isomerase n=1 Tax=Micromonospora sp. WMMD714 TaxID=3016097 RepID=UPI00249BAE8D|nr:peptidylprolyl isomerase [Micromonospora sp. WMMD714]WFE62941.1 peptidylprolyl isomerase [Micromonospora sp. WMMD714]
MKVTYARSDTLDLFLALHRELAGRCSWEVCLLPRPVEPAVAALRDGLRGWRAAGLPIPPAALVAPDGPAATDAATRTVLAAMDAARPRLAPAIAAFAERRAAAEADLDQRLRLPEVGGALAAAMGVAGEALELPVHLVPFAPYPPSVGLLLDGSRVAGTYLDFRRYVGATLADATLTQLGWALLRSEHGPGHLLGRLRALLPGTGPYQRQLRLLLTKTVVELTAGHLVRTTDPQHRPCVEVLGTAWRFPRLYDLVRRHWTPYLDGHRDREAALAAIAAEAAAYAPRWYTENIDGASLAADFYLLEWLAAQGDAPAAERLARWAPQLSADFAGQLDLIIGTELGHYECARPDALAPDLADFLARVNLGDSRVAWWRTRRELGEIPALDLAVDAFAGPGVEYGGEAWAPIAAMLRRYAAGELPARVFIDQCFTLQHNNGCLFDKYFEAEHLLPVLEAQAAGDLATLARHASGEVRRRWQRHRYRIERGYSPQWLGADRAVDLPPPDRPRTGRLVLGAPPPGSLGCGSAEEAEQLTASPADATAPVRDRTWQFRRPWPAVPRRYAAATAVLHTGLGEVRLELWPTVVPYTVDNFVALAGGARSWRDPVTGERRDDPFYDGVAFHRRVPGFVIEAGDRSGTGQGGPGYRIPDEVRPDQVFDRPFLVAMANNGRDSAGSRFFVTLAAARHLDGGFVQFGEVVDDGSRAVVTAIAGASGPVRLLRVTIDATPA